MASSFIYACVRDRHSVCSSTVLIVSSECHHNLIDCDVDLSIFRAVYIFDSRPKTLFQLSLLIFRISPDVIFSIFGPTYYFCPLKSIVIAGLANPHILFPRNKYHLTLPLFQKLSESLLFFLRSVSLYRVNHFICETREACESLSRRSFCFVANKISTVPSGFNPIFLDERFWKPIHSSMFKPDRLRLGIISCNYKHKNLRILPLVLRILRSTYDMDVDIYVTLSDAEFSSLGKYGGASLVNTGPLSLSQCPTFYAAMDAIIFPSLLESFSAVTLESLIAKRPLFISNLPNVNSPCASHCLEFEPLDPFDIAQTIFTFFSLPLSQRQAHVDMAFSYALSLSDSNRQRATSYFSIINLYL